MDKPAPMLPRGRAARPERADGVTRLRPTRLELAGELSFDAWLDVGRRLSEVSTASAWWLGDWLVYGERVYGCRYKHAIAATSLDYQTLRNYAWVARRFEPSRRRDGLSIHHHAEVAALRDAEQDLWLSRAQREGWSRNELRRRARQAKGRAVPGTVVCRITVPAQHEERWQAAAAACGRSLAEWMVTAVDTAADAALSPPALRPSRQPPTRDSRAGAETTGMPYVAATRSAP